MLEKKDLFDFMLKRIRETGARTGSKDPRAFIRWFIELYFLNPQEIVISDGKHDGKVDAFFTTNNGEEVFHHVINSKFTSVYNKIAPPAFYNEITYFSNAFENKDARDDYLAKQVTDELRPKYKRLFNYYDDGHAKLMFITNHRRNEDFYPSVENLKNLEIYHLNDLIQYLIDDIDGAMPKTPPLLLAGIQSVLGADKSDTEVSTSIVFARLIDFINYMQGDPFDLLFARNVRVAFSTSKSEVNFSIRETFQNNPKEFAYSHNGITVVCDHHSYDPGSKELTVINPRVVNGSQTLHTISDVPNPSENARVMVRIIEIPPISKDDIPRQIKWKKDVVANITIRSNQQNAIKKWNLVSNDDFQLEQYRFFRHKNLFYERRDGEWNKRSKELKSAGISKGPGIKKLAQILASYYWDKTELGPATAKSSVAKLFEDSAYETIRNSPVELGYQLYLIYRNIDDSYRYIAKSKKMSRALRGHIDYTLLSLVIKAFRESGALFSHPDLTGLLEKQRDDDELTQKYLRAWRNLTKTATEIIIKFYEEDEHSMKELGEKELTYNNYFKSGSRVNRILRAPLSRELRDLAKVVLV